MSSVDDRVVAMKFDTGNFAAGVAATLGMLDKLKKSLDFRNQQRSLGELQSSAGKFNMGNLGTTIEGINGKLLAMGTIGVTALANITNKAINAGTNLTKALTIDPVSAGFDEYSTNLNSIQTVLANTASAGTTLKDVNEALEQLNEYSDQTIYNFGQMAKNIGTFTAAGVDLETSVASIKGISNLAALSGSSAEQASGAMYQLSQALSAGRVSLQDWNSVVNAGMGGAVFQRALAQTAERMGTLNEGAVKLTGKMKNATINGQSFRESITAKPGEESWLTSEVLTSTLEQFTGDMTDAELAAQGFTQEQIKAIQLTAKNAKAAATEVKTLKGVFDVAKESVGSGWAKTFQLIFGDFEEAKGTFTGLSQFIGGFIKRQADARNQLLKDWRDLGGRDVGIDALKNAFDALRSVLDPIRDAFRDIFPAKTGADLFALTVTIRDFFAEIKLGEDTMENIRRIFRGVFAAVDIVWMVIKGVLGVFKDLFTTIGDGSGGFLDFLAGIGDLITGFRDAIKNGEGLEKFFDGLSAILTKPFELLGKIAGALGSLFGDPGDIDATSASFDGLGKALDPFGRLLEVLNNAWDGFFRILGKVGDLVAKVAPAISDALGGLGDAIADNMSGENFDRVLSTINTGLFAGLTLLIKRFFDNGIKVDVGQLGFFEKVGTTFDALTGHMQAMTQQVKAKTLLMIAGAIGILTLSVVALSLIDADALTRSLGAMTAAFAQLLIAMAIMTKMSGLKGFLKVPAVAASMILLAGAILVLSLALKIMATMSWEELAKGLTGLAGTLAILSLAIIPLSAAQGPMLRSAAAIAILGAAIILLATGMKIFATMDWDEMGRGLVGVVGSLTAIALAMRLMPKGMIAQAAAILAIGLALNAIATAMKIFATMDWQEIAKGLTATVGSLAAIALAMQLMPKGMLLQAVALIAVATALNILGGALKIMASMSWEEIAKGLVTLAGAMVILAVGLNAMSGTLLGSAALVLAAAAIALLTPSLVILGNLEWSTILKAFVTLAGAFLLLGVSALVLTPVIGILAALAAVVAGIGLGMALAGAGMVAFATAISVLVALGTAGLTILTTMITAVIKLIPSLIASFAEGLLELVDVIGNGAPRIAAAFTKIMLSLLEAVIRIAPKIVDTMIVLLDQMLRAIVNNGPKIFRAGLDLIIGFLEAIRDKIPDMARVVAEIIAEFLAALGENIPKIVDAGIQAMVDFINGMADAIRSHSGAIGDAVANLVSAFAELGREIVRGFIEGLTDAVGLGMIADAAGGLVGAAEGGVKAFGKIFSPSKLFIELGKFVTKGFAIGLRETAEVEEALNKMRTLISEALTDAREEIKKQKDAIQRINQTERTEANSKKLDKELKEANKALLEAQAIRKKTGAAAKLYRTELKDEQQKLLALSVQYEKTTEKLEAAQQKLDEAISARDSFAKSTTDSFNKLPDLAEDTSLDAYFDGIRNATEANKKFKATLDALKSIGLDDASYNKFLQAGAEAQPFLDDLLSAGPTAVAELTKIDAALQKSAADIGNKAAKDLYQAAVDAAQGFVNGLAAQQGAIAAQMDAIAKLMVASIKRELGIKSPSTVMEEVGKFADQGLAKGLEKYSGLTKLASANVADLAVQAMRESMADLGNLISSDLDMSPVIAPVLDLTQLRSEAVSLNDILAPRNVQVKVAYDQASVLALETAASKKAQEEFLEQALVMGDTLQFVQNNTSPKALSSAEIYRQTKNQLSIVKGALPK